VPYNVSVDLPAPAGLTILSGMTATAQIETMKKENILVVPNLALKQTGTAVTVQKATGESVTVETGVTDGEYTEITSGLQEGDSVLGVNITVSTTGQNASNSNSAQQLFRLGGGFGGGQRPGGGRD
jgi:hypothetical protein